MASEPRNVTVDKPRLLQTELLQKENVSSPNITARTDIPWDDESWVFMVTSFVTIIIFLFGLVGNGIVIWLLSFRMKRNHYAVYILNLAIADFTYLLTLLGIVVSLETDLSNLFLFAFTLSLSSYSVGMILLMAISVERCASVLWPIWYKCHRPTHLSTIVCTVIWVLFLIYNLMINIFYHTYFEIAFIMWYIYFISLPTFLVLFVSSLTLFIRVQCYSKQRKPSRVYWTIVINVLVFLLLGVPNGVSLVCILSMKSISHTSKLVIFMLVLFPLNSSVNPIIYFFIGRHRQWRRKKPLQEVLQRALMDENEEAEHRRRRTSFPDGE